MVNEAPSLWLPFAERAFAMSQFVNNLWIVQLLSNPCTRPRNIRPACILPLSVCDQGLYIHVSVSAHADTVRCCCSTHGPVSSDFVDAYPCLIRRRSGSPVWTAGLGEHTTVLLPRMLSMNS